MHHRLRLFHALGLALVTLFSAAPAPAGTLQAYVIDADGKPVADVVVYATPRSGKIAREPAKARVVMDQHDEEFVPYVLPVQVGTAVDFPNSDNIRHHVYSFSPAKKFELPLYKGTPTSPIVFDKPGAVALGCNIHDWMIGYIYVVDTPYFAKTGDNGEAHFATLPTGEYDMRAWHPRAKTSLEETRRPAKVGANTTRLEFSLELHPDRRRPRPDNYDPSDYNYQ